MSQIKHTGKLTLRTAWETYYDKEDLSKKGFSSMLNRISMWEKIMPDNPDLMEIDLQTFETFRSQAIAAGYRNTTIKSCFIAVRAICRRLIAPDTGNPRGLGIIPIRNIWMKPVKGTAKPPRRLSLEDLSACYVAAAKAQYPRRFGVHPCDYWRGMLVVAYLTGLRAGDLYRLEWKDIDFETLTIRFTASKTGKYADFPLHPVAAAHLQRLRGMPRPFKRKIDGDFYDAFYREIQEPAGVARFGLHALRKTGASEIERVKSGMASVFLQHKMHDVTSMHYLNQMEELRECINKMRLPAYFQAGPGMQDRKAKEIRDKTLGVDAERLATANAPDPTEWQFNSTMVRFRNRWYECTGKRRVILQRLIRSSIEEPAPATELIALCYPEGTEHPVDPVQTLHNDIKQMQKKLRKLMAVDANYKPIACVERDGNGGKYTLMVPPPPRASNQQTRLQPQKTDEEIGARSRLDREHARDEIRSLMDQAHSRLSRMKPAQLHILMTTLKDVVAALSFGPIAVPLRYGVAGEGCFLSQTWDGAPRLFFLWMFQERYSTRFERVSAHECRHQSDHSNHYLQPHRGVCLVFGVPHY